MDADAEFSDVDSRLEELKAQAGDLLDKSLLRSALNVYGEIQRLAKRERRLIAYMTATFHQMDLHKDMLQPKATAAKAVELIGLLENAERAATIQSDFDEAAYEHTVNWMSACAYENLADATGMMQGYNSDGMHACIADGIEVCRRTGKLGCINCFREYATDVYAAGEDLDMALHHSRTIFNYQGKWSGRGDRRWLGARNGAWILTLLGQLEEADVALKKAEANTRNEEVSLPLQAILRVQADRHCMDLLLGKASTLTPIACPLPAGESPFIEIRWAMAEALRLCIRGEFEAAESVLSAWDRRLQQENCLSEWFEIRLRILAARKMACRTEKLEALYDPLAEKAKTGRDWLTMHRLSALLHSEAPASPLALLEPAKVGPFATAPAATGAAKTPAPDSPPPPAPEGAPPATPLDAVILGFYDRLEAAGEDASPIWQTIVSEILAIDIDGAQITEVFDAGRLMLLLVGGAGFAPDPPLCWAWARRVAATFPQNPAILNLQAELGDVLRDLPESTLKDTIDPAELEKLFRRSLDLDPFNATHFSRAGGFYLRANNLGEAERCFARAFRLARTNSYVALNLAEIYSLSDRPRDALEVLDLSVREGNQDPHIVWQAALKAHHLDMFEPMLTYLERFEQAVQNQPWTSYYKAIGLLETGQAEKALSALDTHERLAPENPFPRAVLRGLAYVKLEQLETGQREFEKVLAIPLSSVETMSQTGIASLFARVWKAIAAWPADNRLREMLCQRMLMAGLAPDEFFDAIRETGEPVSDVCHYRVLIRQNVVDSWPDFAGCLFLEKDWTSYMATWGVLAINEEAARDEALLWQRRCYPEVPAEVVSCDLLAEDFHDRTGVVWLGPRWNDEATTPGQNL